MPREANEGDAAEWAANLIETYSTNVIVTPVYVEFVAGTRSAAELVIARAYLAELRVLDKGSILEREARRLAERVPRDGKPRQMGDCLIKAIANRFRYEVFSNDQGFPG
jgi:predicted nucleic acid-binding protein